MPGAPTSSLARLLSAPWRGGLGSVCSSPRAPTGLRFGRGPCPALPVRGMASSDARMLPLQSLESWFEKWEFKAKHLMCCSDCETRTVRDIVGDRAGELLDLRLGYTEVRGADSLRRAIAKEYYTTMTKDDIVIFTGAEEAIYCAMSTLGKGDHVVCMVPAYQSLWACAEARGATVTSIGLSERKGKWSFDMKGLEEALESRPTKFLVINAPHNPTGWYPTVDEHSRMLELCAKHGVSLFNDEVYRGLEWGKQNAAACDASPKGVTIGVLSKAQGLAGLRLGWLASKDHQLLDRCAELKLYLSICTPAPTELIGEMAVERSRAIVASNREVITQNLEHFKQFLQEHPGWFDWVPPPAGCISFTKVVHPSVSDVTQWCEGLAEKGILIMPGEVISQEWAGYVRLGFGRRDFRDDLRALGTHLRPCHRRHACL